MPGFRLMTINLFTRFVDVADLDDALAEMAPDVMVAQELAPAAAEVIAGRFPHHHLAPDARYSGWGLASRLPVEVEPEKPGWGRGGHGRLELDGRTVHLAAAHILDPMHRPLARTRARRIEQADALVAWGKSRPQGEPQVVAGDMNATPAWEVYKRLAGEWPDLVRQAASEAGGRPRPTWGPPSRTIRLLRIDHVFGTGVEATKVDLRPVRGSDHSALAVDLELV
jgi:endonuclease/exonuclease/phosphatase family metal-dependent hydrolase